MKKRLAVASLLLLPLLSADPPKKSPYMGPLAPNPSAFKSGPDRQIDTVKPTVSIADSAIPGIAIVRPGDKEFVTFPNHDQVGVNGFIIKNASTQTIVSLGVAYTLGEKGLDLVMDGISAELSVPPGESVAVGPYYMKASNGQSAIKVSEYFDGDPTNAYIAFLAFDGGEFLGLRPIRLTLDCKTHRTPKYPQCCCTIQRSRKIL